MFGYINDVSIVTIVLIGILTILVINAAMRVLYDSNNSTQTLGYLLLLFAFPLIGVIFYYTLGVNHRKRLMYTKKIVQANSTQKEIELQILEKSNKVFEENENQLFSYKKTIQLSLHEIHAALTNNNNVTILENGEETFPSIKEALLKAQFHIHIMYYTVKDDTLGKEILGILLIKAKEGVKIRFIYDNIGTNFKDDSIIQELKDAGAEIHAFQKMNIFSFATKLNFRNHRKIIIIDGSIGFTGGLNVSNDYINNPKYPSSCYWRDLHLKIEGGAVHHLQYIFLSDWNYCAEQKLEVLDQYFKISEEKKYGNTIIQMAQSGPDSKTPTILHVFLSLISSAKESIYITTPYFIPNQELLTALIIAAHSGVQVKIVVPEKSDSKFVDRAGQSYYNELLTAGVEIYQYTKGIIHSKTMVIDQKVSLLGTANLDIRSFDLNFENIVTMYDENVSQEMTDIFHKDIHDSHKIDKKDWGNQSHWHIFSQKIARLFSAVL
ncbi:cardiolipin synthase [Candidatus Gracilibacteria bacterium]|nr:cardiolipin synthase [Candidatus Gracilibacteria bacterium]